MGRDERSAAAAEGDQGGDPGPPVVTSRRLTPTPTPASHPQVRQPAGGRARGFLRDRIAGPSGAADYRSWMFRLALLGFAVWPLISGEMARSAAGFYAYPWSAERRLIVDECRLIIENPLTDYPGLLALWLLAGAVVLAVLFADGLATRLAQAAVALAALSHAVTATSFLEDQVLNGRRPEPRCTAGDTPAADALTPLADELYAKTTLTFLLMGILILLAIALTPRFPGATGSWRRAPWRMGTWLSIATVSVWLALQPREDARAALEGVPDRPLLQGGTLTVLTLAGLMALLPHARARHAGRVALGIAVATAFSQWAFTYQLSRSHVTVTEEDGPGAGLTYDTDLTPPQFDGVQHVLDFYSGSMFAAVCIWALIWLNDRVMLWPSLNTHPDQGGGVDSESQAASRAMTP